MSTNHQLVARCESQRSSMEASKEIFISSICMSNLKIRSRIWYKHDRPTVGAACTVLGSLLCYKSGSDRRRPGLQDLGFRLWVDSSRPPNGTFSCGRGKSPPTAWNQTKTSPCQSPCALFPVGGGALETYCSEIRNRTKPLCSYERDLTVIMWKIERNILACLAINLRARYFTKS